MNKKQYAPISEGTEKVGKAVLDAAYKVHTALGPGLLESAYEAPMAYELRKNGLMVKTQVAVPVLYEGIELKTAFRIDMLVENCVVVELKAVETMNAIYEAQLLTYLRLSNNRLGFLINFYVRRLKYGVKRMVV
jgi:GxxExxY protein